MKKVLVITYYWPPTGGSGVQRWLKLCKYLPEFGWEPIVYTPENPDSPLTDASLASNVGSDLKVIKRPIIEPRRIYSKLTGGGSGSGPASDEILYLDPAKRSWKQNALVWARANLLVPDARALWIKPSVRFLTQYLSDNPVDAIVTTGPPHSMHLIGKGLKRKLGIPWIADFRDPWTGIVYFDRLPLTKLAHRRHRKLEASVLEEADVVVNVTPSWAKNDRKRGAKRVETIFNGFDPADQPDTPIDPSEQFTICHLGVFTADRNHDAFWDALSRLALENSAFKARLKIRLLGRVDRSVIDSAQKAGLADAIEEVGYVPHSEAVREMHRARVLLLPINQREEEDPGIIPGKLFEYLASERPILLIGPVDGDAADIVRKTGGGTVCDYGDTEGIRLAIDLWFHDFERQVNQTRGRDIARFSRRNQAGEFGMLLEEITSNRIPETSD